MEKLVSPLDKYTDWQINALHSVLIGDENYYYRKMCRFVSQNFSIPLNEVEKMPVDYVLMHYFEGTYEGWEEKDLVNLAKELCAPDMKAEEEEQIQAAIDTLEQEQARILAEEEGKKESLNVEKQKEFNFNFGE
jgi:uncharacterized protein YdaU (DUF1376 family)